MSFTVNNSAADAGGSTSQSVTISIPSGHTVGVSVYFADFNSTGATINSVVDSAGNTYTLPAGGATSFALHSQAMAYSLAIASSITSVTAAISGGIGGYLEVVVWDLTATGTIAFSDAKAQNYPVSTTGTDAVTTGSMTVSSADALLLGATHDFSNNTFTHGTGFTSDATGPTGFYSEHKAVTASGAATFTSSVSGTALVAGMALQVSGGGSGAIAGTTAITFGQSGALKGAGALVGVSAVVFGQSGNLKGSGALAGSAAIVFGQSGVLVGSGALAGASAIVFGQSGNLIGSGSLSGASSIVFGASGTLTPPSGSLAGTAGFSFDGSATPQGAGALVGAASITFGAAGTLQASGALAGSSAIVFGANGTLVPPGALSGSASITFGASAALQGSGSLAGATAISFDASGSPVQPFVPISVVTATGSVPGFVKGAKRKRLADEPGPFMREDQVFGEEYAPAPATSPPATALAAQDVSVGGPLRLDGRLSGLRNAQAISDALPHIPLKVEGKKGQPRKELRRAKLAASNRRAAIQAMLKELL